MKRILILGANNSQIQLIRAAKEEGYFVIVCDYTDDNPGIPLADRHYQVSYLNKEAVLAIARQEQVDGVVANTDPAMPMAAYIAEQLGLIGNKPESIDKFVSKASFRRLQEEAGLYCPKYFETGDYSDVESKIKDFDYPVIVKPSASAASQGITKIFRNQGERLYDAFQVCKRLSRNGKVTVEESVEMPSLDMIEGDVFVMGEEILWNCIFTTRRSLMAPMIPMTYIFPAILTPKELSIIRTSVSCCLKNAGIRYGEYNVEMYFTAKGELFIIEINPRQGGHRITQMIKEHTGVDFNRLLVTTAVGDNDYYVSVRNSASGRNFLTHHVVFSDCSGTLERIELHSRIRKYVTGVELHKDVGSEVSQRHNATDYIAYVALQFPDRETQLTYSRDQMEQVVYPVVKDMEIPIADCSLPFRLIYDFMTGDAYNFFVPKLEKVHRTAEDYAEQFSSYCTIAYDMDEKNQLTGMVAGYTHNLRIPQYAYIAEVYVNREYRNKGLGEKLLSRFIEHCRSIGLKGVWLFVREDNYQARRLYEKHGFVFDKTSCEDGLFKMHLSF